MGWILPFLYYFFGFIALVYSKQCYFCQRSINSGCDFTIVDSQVGLTTISCNNDCYTEFSISSDSSSSDYEIVRGCSVSPVCTNTSYSVGSATRIKKCCTSENCNSDISQDIFQCYQCSDVDSDISTCKQTAYKGSITGSFATTYCSQYCEKRILIESGVTTVTRSCQNSCGKSFSGTGISSDIYCCQGDLCNTANNFNVSIVEMFAVSFCAFIVIMGFSCQL